MSSTIVNHVWARLTAFTELLRVLMFLRKDDDHFFVVFSSSGSGFQVPLECCCPSYLFFHDFLCEVSAGLVWVNTRINRRIDGSLCWAWRVNNTLQLGKSIVRFAFSALTFVGRLRLCFVLSLLFLEIQLRADVYIELRLTRKLSSLECVWFTASLTFMYSCAVIIFIWRYFIAWKVICGDRPLQLSLVNIVSLCVVLVSDSDTINP